MLSENGEKLVNAMMQQFEGESAEDVLSALVTMLGRVALTVADGDKSDAAAIIGAISLDTIEGVAAWNETRGKDAPAPDWVDE